MSETLILAAIIAPLVLVPAIIVSFMTHVDGLAWPHTEIALPTEAESRFAEFERDMLRKIAASLELTYVDWCAEYALFAIPLTADFLEGFGK